jgi:uncharacterized protein involved in exopolysaccharide biosynthesis
MPQDLTPDIPTEVIPANVLHPVWTQQQDESQSRESIKQLLFLVFKWRWLILSMPVVFTIAVGTAMYMKPPMRVASAKILFKGDRVPLQMADLTSSASSKTPYSQQLLESEIEMIESRGVLLPAARKILIQKGEPDREITDDELNQQVRTLEESLSTIALPDTNVIALNYTATNSEEALQALTAVVEQYQEQHAIAFSGSTELLKFYQQEQDRAGKELTSSEEALRKWQEDNNITAVDAQIKALLDMQGDQETALQKAEAEMAGSRDRDPLVARLKGDLIAAEVALQDLLQRYTDEDRRVQEQREKISLIKQALASAERNIQASLIAEQETLRKQIRETSATLASLRKKQFDFNRLSRPIELHQDAFLLYGKKVEEARIASGMDKEQLANIATIEQPYISSESDLKQRAATVLLAAVVGLLLGLAAAIGFALFNSSLRMEEDVEHYLRLPVLAVIPDLPRSVSS